MTAELICMNVQFSVLSLTVEQPIQSEAAQRLSQVT